MIVHRRVLSLLGVIRSEAFSLACARMSAPPPDNSANTGAPVSRRSARAVPCPVMPAGPGVVRSPLLHDALMRKYQRTFRAATPTPPSPLLFYFRGAMMTAKQQRELSGTNAAADDKRLRLSANEPT
jgi:poly(3-hydroxybutyrate) depolymerase